MFLGEVTFSNIQHYEITGDKKNDISNLEKAVSESDIIMIGEDHNDYYVEQFVKLAAKLMKPDYFLTEHTQWLDVHYSELSKRIIGLGRDGLPMNKFTGKLLKNLKDINFKGTVIGMDYDPTSSPVKLPREKVFERVVYSDEYSIPESFKLREVYMLQAVRKYGVPHNKILVQVGDSHLRSTSSSFFGPPSPLITGLQFSGLKISYFRLLSKYREVQ